jgi:hypothetical protein
MAHQNQIYHSDMYVGSISLPSAIGLDYFYSIAMTIINDLFFLLQMKHTVAL